MIGLHSFWVGFLSAVLSFLALWQETTWQKFVKDNISKETTIVTGLLLIALGMKQIIWSLLYIHDFCSANFGVYYIHDQERRQR